MMGHLATIEHENSPLAFHACKDFFDFCIFNGRRARFALLTKLNNSFLLFFGKANGAESGGPLNMRYNAVSE